MRRQKKVTIPGKHSQDPGHRDNGKTFILHEMPADQGERWCMRVADLITRAVGNPLSTEQLNTAGAAMGAALSEKLIAYVGALTDPSVDEFWQYVLYQHAANLPPRELAHGENSDIEEISTRRRIRIEYWELMTGFLKGAEPQNSAADSAKSD